ncbi:MAG TPA: tRNA uridine-5-carboxymethylaminomethyl(34) synthesis GTPase MnmE [Xanthomonadales bacterium]|nr:tRNA uridine-5-carboxymethylaminomethyl(34) synthesis GTPase MnmE [Xanthomonadales bacterium]
MNIDTICAVATPPGVGGVGVVRLSGPSSTNIAKKICGVLPPPRHAAYVSFHDRHGEIIDRGLLLYFAAPASFTGEDVVELQAHGGPQVMNMLMRRALELGARTARPGEFSERAFLNDKLDLAQAEAIADLVESGTEAAARAAQRSLSGEFSARVNDLQEKLTALRVYVEAAIDFPDEEIDFLADGEVLQRVEANSAAVQALLATSRQGQILRDGIWMAIIGRPNAGKSSLLNALSGQDRAIVTEIPGTTRDLLRESIEIDGIPVHLVDTAGIRHTVDPIEAEGVRRAREALMTADLVLLVVDQLGDIKEQLSLLQELPDPDRVIVVFNKEDLQRADWDEAVLRQQVSTASISISAKTGLGLQKLRSLVRNMVGATEQPEGLFSARQRHVDALRRATAHLEQGRLNLVQDGAAELLAEELRLAQRALSEITGDVLPDDLLGAIFASFCIGK